MLALPIINACSNAETRPRYLHWLRRVGADRVFLSADGYMGDSGYITDEVVARYAENVDYYRENGYESGIWVCAFGHGGGELFGALAERMSGMTRLCDLETGESAGNSFCPTDPLYRQTFMRSVARLASTHPDLIMLDDDLRLSIHTPVMLGCACPRHMAMFNERARREGVIDCDMTREELATFLFNGKATPHRRVWLDVMGDTLRDFARDLRATVDAVDPNIRLGHCAVLSTWGLDGVDSIELARIMAGKTRPFMRLIGAAYWENVHPFRMTSMGDVTNLVRMQVAWCRQYAPDIELMSEGDVYPRPRYNVPAAYGESYHQVLTADGFSDILKYMFDYRYEPDYETGYLRLHERKAPLRDAMTESILGTESAGIYIYEKMNKWADADCTGWTGADCINHFTPISVTYAARLGLPATYERTRYTPVTLVFGDNAHYISEEALDSDMILDAVAAGILMGRGIDIGLAAMVPMEKPRFEKMGDPMRIFPVDTESDFFCLTPKDGGYAIGTYDTDAPSVLVCPRENGKRAIIYAFDMDKVSFDSVYMKNDNRRRQVLDIIRDVLPVDLPEARFYVICRKSEEKTVVGVWNFSRDIGLPEEGIKIAGLREGSTVTPIGEGHATICNGAVNYEDEIPPFCFGGFVVKH